MKWLSFSKKTFDYNAVHGKKNRIRGSGLEHEILVTLPRDEDQGEEEGIVQNVSLDAILESGIDEDILYAYNAAGPKGIRGPKKRKSTVVETVETYSVPGTSSTAGLTSASTGDGPIIPTKTVKTTTIETTTESDGVEYIPAGDGANNIATPEPAADTSS